MVAGHDDRPKKFLPGHVLFLTSQNIGGKVFLFVILQKDKNQRSTGEELTVCSRMRVCVTGQHDQ